MSIFETIGGDSVFAEAVDEFYRKLLSDPVIAVFFESTDTARLTTHQRMFLTAALGGPDAYEGRDMRAAHAHLQITDADFEKYLEFLAETLAEHGATPAHVAEVLEALTPLRAEIVSATSEGADEWGSTDKPGGSG
jgi:hemoglobin